MPDKRLPEIWQAVRLCEQYTLARGWELNGTSVPAAGRQSGSLGFAIRLLAQRFGSMSRHIGQN
jgi:hypothetical protein